VWIAWVLAMTLGLGRAAYNNIYDKLRGRHIQRTRKIDHNGECRIAFPALQAAQIDNREIGPEGKLFLSKPLFKAQAPDRLAESSMRIHECKAKALHCGTP
jgi:hypothetical protein